MTSITTAAEGARRLTVALGATACTAAATSRITLSLSTAVLCLRRHWTAKVPPNPARGASSGWSAATMAAGVAPQTACTGSKRITCGALDSPRACASPSARLAISVGSSASSLNRSSTVPAQPVCATEKRFACALPLPPLPPPSPPPSLRAASSAASLSPAVPLAEPPSPSSPPSPAAPAAAPPPAKSSSSLYASLMALCSRCVSQVMRTPRMPRESSHTPGVGATYRRFACEPSPPSPPTRLFGALPPIVVRYSVSCS
mmetsp:Transcript_25625/g.81290  ORF Transcript_25625/g.81290 Transcript_25625/m.81290 type:complete len:259 (+) Transcript_25625:281-1057(+)